MKWLIMAALLALPFSASAQQCVPTQAMLTTLVDDYGERLFAMREFEDGSSLQFFANSETGTWTVFAMLPNGISCMIAVGRQWDGTHPPDFEPVSARIGRGA